jgi:peptidoglycan/LPS O-acetylase OafA/YrhL
MKPSTLYLSNLTPLRGIAALLTVMFHIDLVFGGPDGLLIHHGDSLVFTKMYLMVDFFFVLSGFIMCHVYGEWFKGDVDRTSFKKFTIARFARVYPLHFFTLLYLVLVKFAFTELMGVPPTIFEVVSESWATIPSHLLLLHSMNVNEWFTWNNASWSISTEWWMYMLFPFLVAPFSKLKTSGKLAVLLACFAGYLMIMYWIVPIVTVPETIFFTKEDPATLTINVAYQYGFLRCLFGFVIGMVVYDAYRAEFTKNLVGNGYAFVLFTLGLLLCLHFAVPDVFTAAFFPALILSAAYGSRNVDKFFSLRPLQRIGELSFSIYLVHQPLIYTFFHVYEYLSQPKPAATAPAGPEPTISMLMGWIICFAFIIATMLVSYLTYRFIEVPCRNYINSKAGTGQKRLEPAV